MNENNEIKKEDTIIDDDSKSVKEKKKCNINCYIIILVILVLGIIGYFVYSKFYKNDNINKVEENMSDKLETDDKNINDSDTWKIKIDELGVNVNCPNDNVSWCNIGLFADSFHVEKVLDNSFAIIKNYAGQFEIYLLVNKNGNFLKDINGKDIIGDNTDCLYMEYRDNKIYYNIPIIYDIDEHSHAKTVCGYYKDDDIVSKDYYREYLGNGIFGEEVLIKDNKVSDEKAKEKDLNGYCKEYSSAIFEEGF